MTTDASSARRTMRQISEEFIATHPDPSDPVAHTLSVYAEEPDEAFVIVASGNIYGDGVRTGLTWGDLRRLAKGRTPATPPIRQVPPDMRPQQNGRYPTPGPLDYAKPEEEK
jgi:hypothetical protein